LRLVAPGWYGMTNVKWLTRITAVTEPFAGYQNAEGYRFKREPGDPGRPVTRMRPRALMIPPGVPEFITRRRIVELGPVTIAGRAWSGFGPITAVEVSADGGASWFGAALEPPADAYAWCGWSWTWTPPGPGEYELWCRARDATGAEQPLDADWNLKGYANTAVQRVPVTVR
jgi:sulfane dehydrogenase subunit SoxC